MLLLFLVLLFNFKASKSANSYDSCGVQPASPTSIPPHDNCKCGDEKIYIKCSGENQIYPLSNNNQYYCNGMNCNYQIMANESCPNSYISVTITPCLHSNNDYLLLKDNDILIQNYSTSKTFISPNYISNTFSFSTQNKITLEFHSGNDQLSSNNFWYASVQVIPSPNFANKITLNETKTRHIQWLDDMNQNDGITVCAKIGTLEIFVTYDSRPPLYHFALYDSDGLNQMIGFLNSDALSSSSSYIPKNLQSKSQCFTLYFNSNASFIKPYAVLFRILEENTKNCENSDNVFQIFPIGASAAGKDALIKSKPDGACEMIILSFSFAIPRIWIDYVFTKGENTNFTFSSAFNGRKLFELSSSDANAWQSFGIYTPALTITAPPASEISVHLSNAAPDLNWITVPSSGVQKGVIISPSYSGFMKSFESTKLYESSNYYQGQISASFYVKEMKGANVLIGYDGTNQTLNQNLSMKTDKFFVFYGDSNPQNNEFFIEYNIQPINNAEDKSQICLILLAFISVFVYLF